MTRTLPVCTGVPAAYEPSWRDLPRLAWVAARGYVPASVPGAVAPILAVCSLLIWLPSVVHLRAGRRLAGRGRTAMVAIEPVGRRALRELAWPVGAAALAMLGVMGVLLAAGLGVADLALRTGVEPGTAIAAATVPIAMPVLAAGVLISPWRVIRSNPRLGRTVRSLQAESPETAIWRLSALAAWPRGQGNGGALLEGLLRDWEGGGYAVANARDPAVEDWYLRLGMRQHPAGGALVLDLRTDWGRS